FYLIALLQKLSSLLLAKATIGLSYDIACLLDRTTFHAYAHQFCCQIVFHPHKCVSLG
ncbi:hypothetical protein M422DRAFT_162469, partial [Sphaerobolus stellatus SS14]